MNREVFAMEMCFITFRSVTPAQRGEALLRKRGLRCSLGRTPGWLEEKGCGYCLRMRPEQIRLAAVVLREGQVPFRKIYLQDDTGKTEEMAL